MDAKHKRSIDFGNPVRNLVGQPRYGKKPSASKILSELLDAMTQCSDGTCWAPVNSVDTQGRATIWTLMLKQCPGACGHVWSLKIKDDNVARWLVNEINQRRVREAKGR